MSKIVRLTEDELHRIIKNIITEMDYRVAALTHGANYNAQQDFHNTKNPNAKIKMGDSENLTNKALSQAIHDNFPNLKLEFIEHNEKTNRSYPVDFDFKEVKYHDNDRIVLLGDLTVSLNPFGIGTIEYQVNTQSFYRVSYSDKTTRSRKIHTLMIDNVDVSNSLLSFISNYMYSKEDYETNINNHGSTTSRPR